MPEIKTTRRRFIAGTSAVAGATLLTGALSRPAWAAFPERNLEIVIPTAEGGGADRDIRIFTSVWKNHIETSFEYSFFPGAAGQVGYEVYGGKREPDCYSLLFANMGPEVIMQALQKPSVKLGEDFVYINQISSEVMSLFVPANSQFQSIEQLVEEGKKRTVTIAVSRLPHPASIGCLALAEATGANFQLVPYGGGNPSAMAAITGEVDACALPLANPIKLGEQVKILTTFGNNPALAETGNAPAVNSVFGTKIPELTSSRGFGLHTKAIEQYPDRFEVIKSSMEKVKDDPAYPEAVKKAGLPTAFIDFGDKQRAMQGAEETLALAAKYEALLTGK
ncbi:MAG: twin-arginine translocation signal domain-containing protein [Kiloniellaceae bacterium]|nr:twin-arginine translocation signal domain-containing protein [Kiloniellaceae bacterium]